MITLLWFIVYFFFSHIIYFVFVFYFLKRGPFRASFYFIQYDTDF